MPACKPGTQHREAGTTASTSISLPRRGKKVQKEAATLLKTQQKARRGKWQRGPRSRGELTAEGLAAAIVQLQPAASGHWGCGNNIAWWKTFEPNQARCWEHSCSQLR